MKRSLLGAVLAVALSAAAVSAQHRSAAPGPETVSMDSWGTVWFSAAHVLNPDGSVSSSVSATPNRELERQNRWFAERFGSADGHGLVDGSVPPRRFCRPRMAISSPPIWDKVTDVLGSLLLAEVAVSAEVAAVDPGFRAGGAPVLRLTLSDVEPMRAHSLLPTHVLVPISRLVIRDYVYCGDDEGLEGHPPAVGDQLVVVGPWGSSATVNVGHIGVSSLAVVRNGALEWLFGHSGPKTIGELRELIRESEAEGLFDLTSGLVRMPYGTEERHRFGLEWNRVRARDCRPAVESLGGGEARLVCGRKEID